MKQADLTPSTQPMTPNLAIISGEVSGDIVGGALARELLKRAPNLRLWGIGSRAMRDAGVELLQDSGQWSAIGVVEALKVYPILRYRMYPQVIREIQKRSPAIVVLIDFGAFNFKVARWCRSHGIRVFYYFPPGSWKRRSRVREEIARVADCVATPFPWSEDNLKAAGANAHFVGHPLLEVVKPSLTRSQFADRFGMDPGRPTIGLLPGSRPFEIEHNAPVMIQAAAIIQHDIPDSQFVFGAGSAAAKGGIEAAISHARESKAGVSETTREIADTVAKLDKERRRRASPRLVTTEGVLVSLGDAEDMKKRALRGNAGARASMPPFVIAENMAYDVMAHTYAIIVCSGTATLEAAILGAPMVIIYRGSRLMEVEYRVRRIKVEHIGLPNIVADDRVVPEFIQNDATPEALAEAALKYLRDPAYRARTKEHLSKVKQALGDPGASSRTAELVLATAGL